MIQDPRAIFIHIPRTGGTTIRQLFGWGYPGSPTLLNDPRPADLFSQLNNFAVCHHADALRAMMTDAEWASYYKFTVVRNPWDRMVSYYFYSQTIKGLVEPGETFTQWVHRRYVDHVTFYGGNSYGVWYKDDANNLLVDKICRYENFDNDVREICDRLGVLHPSVSIPRTNQIARDHYSVYYDTVSKDLVTELYAEDIKFFGYEF